MSSWTKLVLVPCLLLLFILAAFNIYNFSSTSPSFVPKSIQQPPLALDRLEKVWNETSSLRKDGWVETSTPSTTSIESSTYSTSSESSTTADTSTSTETTSPTETSTFTETPTLTEISSTTSISSSSGTAAAASGDVFYNRFKLRPIYIILSLIYLVIITSCTGSQRRVLQIWPTSSNIFPNKTISNTKDTEQMSEVLSHQSKWRRWKEDFVHQRSQL